VTGDLLLSANGYGAGVVLLKLVREGEGIVAQEQYHHPFNFDPFQDNAVLVGDHVYACQASGLPVCIDLKTGKPTWGPVRTAIKGGIALTYADGHLYLRGSDGLMISRKRRPRNTSTGLPFRSPNRPLRAARRFPSSPEAGSVRDNDKLLAYDISGDALKKLKREARTA
jgi:hypothetical protein